MPEHRLFVEAPVRAALHRAPEVRPELDGEEAGLVRPVLEDSAGDEELLKLLLRVRADAARERQPMRPVHSRDRVELHRAEPADRVLHLSRPRAAEAWGVPLRRDGVPPNCGEADGGGLHGSYLPATGAAPRAA